MAFTLADIRQLVRDLTGRPSEDQITDLELNTRINDYYVRTMPFELKEQIENQFLSFKTTPGQDVYSFPGGYFTDSPGAYADGFPLVFYQDPDVFYQDWPIQYAVDNIATGDGAEANFPGGLQNPPVQIGSLFITSNDPTGTQPQQIIADTNSTTSPTFPTGTLTGDGVGTINYLTGAYNVTFNTIPVDSAVIYAKYIGYSGNRPQGVLWWNNQFTLRPIPDQDYQIQMQGYVKPTELTDDSDTPLQEEWGWVIGYGAALDIFARSGDQKSYDELYPLFKRFENVALGRTIQQYTASQSVPRF